MLIQQQRTEKYKRISKSVLYGLFIAIAILTVAAPASSAHAQTLSVQCRNIKAAIDARKQRNLDVSVLEEEFNRNCSQEEQKTITDTEAKEAAAQKEKDKFYAENSGSCFWNFSFATCIWIPLLSYLGAFLMTFSGYMLEWAAYFFDMLVRYIVIGFGSTLQELKLIEGVHTGWEVLRDISNIVIIGMFTFIAISMILGVEKFGAKRLVANVLIIAVLINFSLLFSKIIIDTGNFAAYQFYKGMGESGTTGGAKISSRFISLVGATSFWDSKDVGQRFATAATKAGEASGAGFWANLSATGSGLLYQIVASVMLLFAAGVLFYGCYLIAVRGILLIFLMMMSALAFASYLIPKISDSGYGWQTWWRSLVNASIFAPLLMALLYINLVILSKTEGINKGSLGVISSDPSKMADNWQVLFIFILGIGMLLVSFKVANSFSKQIAGFSTAATGLKWSVGMPLAIGSRIAGLAGRTFIGRRAARGEIETNVGLGTAQQKLRMLSALGKKGTPEYRQALQDVVGLNKKAARQGRLAEGSFKATQTDLGKRLMKTLEVPGAIVGKDQRGVADDIKKTAQEAANKGAAAAKMSKDEEAAIRKRADETVRRERDANSQKLQKEHEAREAELKEAKQAAEEKKSANESTLKANRREEEQALENQKKIRNETNTALKQLVEEAKRPGANQDAIKVQIEKTKQESKNLLEVEEKRINDARKLAEQIAKPVAYAEHAMQQAKESLDAHEKETDTLSRAAEDDAIKQVAQAAEDVAVALTRSGVKNIIPTAMLQRTDNSAVVAATKDLLGKRIKAAPTDDMFAELAKRLQAQPGASAQKTAPESKPGAH